MIDVFTYDSNCVVLKQPFIFVSEDLSGVQLAIANASAIRSLWGAQLTWASRVVDTYNVVISDLSMTYPPVVIGPFNATNGGTFEVIILKLPPGGSISGGGSGWSGPDESTTLESLLRQIAEHTTWDDEEKEAVKTLILTFVAVAEHRAVKKFVSKWTAKLEAFGVPVAALTQQSANRNAYA